MMKKVCSIVTALVMALTIFVIPNLGFAYAEDEEDVVVPAAAEDVSNQGSDEDVAAPAEEGSMNAAEGNDGEDPGTEPDQPTQLTKPVLTVSSSSEAITFSWEAVEGAEGYLVSEDGVNYTPIDSTSYVLAGTGVTLYVKAKAGDLESEEATLTLKAPSIKLTLAKAGVNTKTGLAYINYEWTTAATASGYAIRRGTDVLDNYKYRENGTSAKYTWTGLAQRAKYRFYARAYVEVPKGTEGGLWINPQDPSIQAEQYKYVLLGPATTTKNPTATPPVERCDRTKYDRGYKYKYYDQKGIWRGTSYAMWNTIKNKKSKTKYLIALDTRRNNIVIYKGKAGSWVPYKHFVCACGVDGHRTPRGDFKVQRRKPKFQTGDKVGAVVVRPKYTCWYATKFKGAVFFHSTLYYLNSKSRHAARHVGKHYSHGCVRLEIGNAKWIYKNCKKGTAVISRKYGADCSYGYQYSYSY